MELAALECLENLNKLIMGEVVTTLVFSIKSGSSLFLQIRRATIKA